jgi:hypothetical protein
LPDIAPEHSADPLGSIDPLSAAYKQICIKLYKQQQEIIALLTEAVRLAPIPPRSDFHRPHAPKETVGSRYTDSGAGSLSVHCILAGAAKELRHYQQGS